MRVSHDPPPPPPSSSSSSSSSLSGESASLLVPPEAITTNAVSRNLSDLHTPTWLALLAINITGRTVIFHPMQLAISRKRVTRAETPPTVGALMRAAYRGGKQSFSPPASGPVDTFNFGRGGVRGCYRGVGAALFSNLVGEMSYLFTLETLKEYLGGNNRRDHPACAREEEGKRAVRIHEEAEEEEAGGSRRRVPPVSADAFVAHSTSAAAGAMAGDLIALLLVTPTVVICNRQMTAGYGMAASNAYRSFLQTFREVWGTYQDPNLSTRTARGAAFLSPAWWHCGFRGLYQGTTAGLLRIPSSGCWWALYTKSKEVVYRVAAPTLTRWEERRQRERGGAPGEGALKRRRSWLLSPTDNPVLNAVAGIFASVSTTVLFNPMAVIQTRQQSLPPEYWAMRRQRRAQKDSAEALAARTATLSYRVKRRLPFHTVYAVAADLVRTEGPLAFFKGTSANVAVAVMDGVVFSLLFELSKLGSDTQFLKGMGVDPTTEGPKQGV